MRITHLPLIIGLASGFAVLILALGLTWIIHLRRSRSAKRQWQKTLRADLEKERPDIQVVHSESAFDNSLTHSEKHDAYKHPYANYQMDRFTSKPQPHSRARRARGWLPPEQLPPYDLRRAPVQPHRRLSFANGATLTVPTNIAPGTSYDSSDTASMYSTASAPIELHDQILRGQPMSRPLAFTAQPRASSPPTSRRPRRGRGMHAIHRVSRDDHTARVYPIMTVHTLAPHPEDYVDPLAPEVYDKTLTRRSAALPILAVAETPTSVRFSGSVRKQRTPETPRDNGALPPHLWPTLDPPTPSAKRSTPLLYRKVSQPFLPSPYSPAPWVIANGKIS